MTLTLSLFGDTALEETPLSGVSIDSRTIQPGELFAAVRGERFNGHDYIDKAITAGCAAIIADHMPNPKPDVPVLIVADVLQTLGKAANAWRRLVNPLVVAVTGSCGKTTVKEMLLRCMQHQFSVVHATQGNFNNHIGLPLTILAMPGECQALVVEMGMSAAGEIAYLAKIAQPSIGIVTNVLPAHLEAFDSLDDIADAKGELLQALPDDGVAIIPADQPHSEQLRQKAGITPTLTVGLHATADIFGQPIQTSPTTTSLHIQWQQSQITATIPLASPGEHIQQNLLCVAAAAQTAGLTPTQIKKALGHFSPAAGRGGVRQSPQGWRVIDDSYNANPGSVKAALRALPKPLGSGRRIAILGDMLELGKEADILHRSLCQVVIESGIDQLYTTGPLMQALYEEVKNTTKMPHTLETWHRSNPSQWLGHITPNLRPEDVVLVKGSRGMKMERIVENLVTHAL